MAKAALRDVSKAPVENFNTLASLIDQAGKLREERGRIDKAYNKLRTEIEGSLAIPTPGEETIEEGAEYKAKLAFQMQKKVKIKELFRKQPEVFWALVEIPFKAMEDALGPNDALKFQEIVYKDAPSLNIDKKK